MIGAKQEESLYFMLNVHNPRSSLCTFVIIYVPSAAEVKQSSLKWFYFTKYTLRDPLEDKWLQGMGFLWVPCGVWQHDVFSGGL